MTGTIGMARRSAGERSRVEPTIYLVRHAHAKGRESWEGPDSERPLTTRGLEQSRLLASHLTDLEERPPSRLLSSPAVRCQQTLQPLALTMQLEVVPADWLNEGSEAGAALEQLRALAARLDPPSGVGGPIAACTHGDVVWGVLESLHRSGVDLGPQPGAPKGGVWILASAPEGVASARFYHPGDGRRDWT